MFLSRFRVRGYKCLEDVDVALTPIHVLIGPSDSGKTSLLEAISAFYGRLKTPATQWFPAVANPRELITHGSSVPTIDLAGQWSEMPPPGGPPLPAAGYGYSILVPPSGANFAIMDQWVRPRAGKDPQSGLTRVAIAFPHGAGPAKAEDRAAVQATFRDTVQKMLEPAPVYRLDPRRWPNRPRSIPRARPDGCRWPRPARSLGRDRPAASRAVCGDRGRILPLGAAVSRSRRAVGSAGDEEEIAARPPSRTRTNRPPEDWSSKPVRAGSWQHARFLRVRCFC